jgi:hypothetical protein
MQVDPKDAFLWEYSYKRLKLATSGPTWHLSHFGEAEAGDVLRVAVGVARGDLALAVDCPGRKPPFFSGKRPARPYKTTIQNGFT